MYIRVPDLQFRPWFILSGAVHFVSQHIVQIMKSIINTTLLLASTSLFGTAVQAACNADKYAPQPHSPISLIH
jgi:hypothetical protein